MDAPIPRAWFGLAILFAVAAAAVITSTGDGWTRLVPASDDVPLLTRRVLLTLELAVLALVIEATWWVFQSRRSRKL